MIPYIRGRYHSRNAESIISEVRDLVAGGVRGDRADRPGHG